MSEYLTVIQNAQDFDMGAFKPKEGAHTEGVEERAANVWEKGKIQTGVWQATEGEFSGKREGYNEICIILEGRATIKVEGEPDRELKAGDIFVTPEGWAGTWVVHEKIKKHYVIVTN